MEARHAAATPYQQRIWKVTNALDRLAVMCEQHHLQTKHVDGLPDWTVPKAAAGVASRVASDTPPNFAWHDAKPVAPLDMKKPESEETDKPTTKMEKEELSSEELEQGERVMQELRASTSELLSRLSPPSLRSSVSSTTAPVFPQPASQQRDYGVEMKATEALVGSRSRTHSSTESSQSMSSRYDSRPVSTRSVREAGEPHRRRKVQFADHSRSYRGNRPTKRMVDLTYHEALRAIAPSTSSAAGRRAPEPPQTTYQQTYQWPRREAFVAMMDSVGGQTAGGGTWYEPRRVFTAEDAMVVANESARDLLKNRQKSSRENVEELLENESRTVEEKQMPHSRVMSQGPTVSDEKPAVNQTVVASPAQGRASSITASSETRKTKASRPKPLMPPTRVEASTQTEKSLPVKKPIVQILEQAPTGVPPVRGSHHSGFCSHCGRSGDVGATKKTTTVKDEEDERVRERSRKQALARLTRVNPQRDNPIFVNARYPSEPSVFRPKSTYTTVFGKPQVKRR